MVASGETNHDHLAGGWRTGFYRVAAISAQSEQPEIAKMFVNFLLDAKTQQALVDTGDEGYFYLL